MEELMPIRKIKVNFGTPLSVQPPSSADFFGRLQQEAQDVEDDPYDIHTAEISLWESSITPEERTEYHAIAERVEAALDAYNPKVHPKDSPEAKAYDAVNEEYKKFFESRGKHLCHRCSYYFFDKYLNGVSVCERPDQPIYVRPYSIACPYFTTDMTPAIKKAREAYERVVRSHPELESRITAEMRLSNARHFAKLLKESTSAAFYLYSTSPDYYEKVYAEFPLLFIDTPYVSYPLFLEAYHRWEKDVIIKKKQGKHGPEVTLSVSNPEFTGTDGLVPQTTTQPSEN